MTNYNRRIFIKNSSTLLAGALAMQGASCIRLPNLSKKNKLTFGIQLYTLRDIIEQSDNPIATIQSLAAYGYKHIESYDGPKGIYWGLTNKEFVKRLQDVGLSLVSSHVDMFHDFEKKVEAASQIGISYLICPWLGAQKSLDDYKKFATQFNQSGEICRKHGIKFAYHNHAYSFTKLDGVFPQDLFCTATDASLVDFEMDMYWVINAGQDIEEWLKKYPGRFTLCHIKDQSKTNKNLTCTLGTGSIDYKHIISVAKQYGMKYFHVEQEQYNGTTPLDCARDNAAYLKTIRI